MMYIWKFYIWIEITKIIIMPWGCMIVIIDDDDDKKEVFAILYPMTD